jgi:prevent-host-death family protein
VLGANAFRDQLGYWIDRAAAGEEIVISRRGRPQVRMTAATVARTNP